MATIKRVPWAKISSQLRTTMRERGNKDLFDALDAVAKNLKEQARVWVREQGFGETIIKDGRICLEDEDAKQALADTVPFGVVLLNATEVFLQEFDAERMTFDTFPYAIIGQGDMFGVFETVDRVYAAAQPRYSNHWCMTSGARSAHFLHPLGNKALKRLLGVLDGSVLEHLGEDRPTRFAGGNMEYRSWELFRALRLADKPDAIANNPVLTNDWTDIDWCTRVALFPDAWFSNGSSAAAVLQRVVQQKAWDQITGIRTEQLSRESIRSCLLTASDELRDALSRSNQMSAVEALAYADSVLEGFTPCHRVVGLMGAGDYERLGPFVELTNRFKLLTNKLKLTWEPAFAIPTYRGEGRGYVISLSRRPRAGISKGRSWPQSMKDIMEIYASVRGQDSGGPLGSATLVPIHKGCTCMDSAPESGTLPAFPDHGPKQLFGLDTKSFNTNHPFLAGCLALTDEG